MELFTFSPKRRVQTLIYLMVVLVMVGGCGGKELLEEAEVPGLVLKTELVVVESPKDIRLVTDSLVAPLLYSNIKGLNQLPLDEKKMRFISALLPAILVAKEELELKSERFSALIERPDWTTADSLFFQELSTTYRTSDTTAIILAMKTHPNSIVLAQAAVESGWGNSRLFGQANNLFGIWSYRTNEPRIAAAIQRGDKTIYLRKYQDVSESISDYFVTLGRSRPYASFRKARMETDSVELLLPHLLYYSERREDYVRQLASMIRYNNLKRFDDYRLDSAYYVPVTDSIR